MLKNNQTALIDADLVFKFASINISEPFKNVFKKYATKIAIPLSFKYVVPSLMRKKIDPVNIGVALSSLEDLLAFCDCVEPTEEELILSAQIETIAQDLNLAIDIGESMIIAIFITRQLDYIATGDKRAIKSLPELCIKANFINAKLFIEKLICLEQIIVATIQNGEWAFVRDRICLMPHIDKTLQICFSCSNNTINEEGTLLALSSYIADLKRLSGNLLNSYFTKTA